MSHTSLSLGDLIRAVTAQIEATGVALHKRSVSDTEYCYYTQDGRQGRLYVDAKGAARMDGELFSGVDLDAALDALERRNADDALSREQAKNTPKPEGE